MKRSLKVYVISVLGLAFLSLSLALGSSVCDNAPCEPLINVSAGEEFNITLPSNPSTGFGWWNDFDPQFLSLVGTGSSQGNASPKMVGLPEKTILTYRAESPGETEIYLLLLQPWEGGIIEKRLIYPVLISE